MDQNVEREVARLMAMEQTFDTEGWKEIVKELEGEVEYIKDALLVAAPEHVQFLQGKADQCMRMIHLADAVSNTKDTLVADEVEDRD